MSSSRSSLGGCTFSSRPAIRPRSPRRSPAAAPTCTSPSRCSSAAVRPRPRSASWPDVAQTTAPGTRRVFSVATFNEGLAGYVDRLGRDYWVEGEISELSRNERWAYAFLTLKDPRGGATLPLTMFREAFDRLPPAARARRG